MFSQNDSLNLFEVTVFDTFKDFTNLEKIDEGNFLGFKNTIGPKIIMRVEKNNIEKKIIISGKWGFKIGSMLYRMDKNNILHIYNMGRFIYRKGV